uniref:RNA-directed DNA polymerase, eukaryota n=1 Tax=Tanacetum cinerariifolium TaxID=118510 RepID=A0A699IJG7_TANCI|nr:RNA-directed DNA polymerase, eukaryota [Tanacetum cinerariifolium]
MSPRKRNQMEARDYEQKSKIKWAIKGDENSKFFHGIINKKRSKLSIREVFVDGDWNTDPEVVKDVFKDHFATHFKQPSHGRLKLNISFPDRLSTDQVVDMDRSVSWDEIRVAVWNCGENKSPGPNGLTLLKSVLGASPLQNMSIYKVPKGNMKEMEAIRCSVTLSASKDRWICDLNGDGVFRVKEVPSILDDIFLPSAADATRWVKYIPIKINVFGWRDRLDRLPTRSNIVRRVVVLDSSLCPLCGLVLEVIHHVLFRCDTAKFVFRRICRWWDMDWHDLLSFSD